jgi:hypothetical protein
MQKVIPVGTVPRMGGGEGDERAVDQVKPSMIYLIHCKSLCKCYNVPPPSTTRILKKEKK